jgi:hypothetical protein
VKEFGAAGAEEAQNCQCAINICSKMSAFLCLWITLKRCL